MNWKSKLVLGMLTALAMMFLTYALPRGGSMRDATLVQFPVTVGVGLCKVTAKCSLPTFRVTPYVLKSNVRGVCEGEIAD